LFGLLAALFVADVARKAIFEAFVHPDFPEELAIKVEQLPLIFPIHMLTGGLALLLLPAVIALRRRRPTHRLLGRIAATDVAIAGVTALPVAWVAPVSAWSAAGFIAQAITWMTLLAVGIWNIRHGRRGAHRRAMLLMTATASGAIFFRVYLALWAIFAGREHFVLFYSCDSWLAWLGPLVLTAYGLKRRWRILT
jgi:uncharacterized membrane protein YozB (DUF420 family)